MESKLAPAMPFPVYPEQNTDETYSKIQHCDVYFATTPKNGAHNYFTNKHEDVNREGESALPSSNASRTTLTAADKQQNNNVRRLQRSALVAGRSVQEKKSAGK